MPVTYDASAAATTQWRCCRHAAAAPVSKPAGRLFFVIVNIGALSQTLPSQAAFFRKSGQVFSIVGPSYQPQPQKSYFRVRENQKASYCISLMHSNACIISLSNAMKILFSSFLSKKKIILQSDLVVCVLLKKIIYFLVFDVEGYVSTDYFNGLMSNQ